MILLADDGSADAQAAMERAAQLMPGAQTTVLTIWEPFMEIMARTGAMAGGFGVVGGFADAEKIDAAARKAALASASDGARRASAAGLSATARCAGCDVSVAHTILTVAAELDADVIVMGTRGLSGLKSVLLGSVSHAVLQHADRAVLIVPSPVLAKHRHEHGRQLAPPA